MTGTASYNTAIKQPGTATTFTDEATTNTSGNVYQVTDATKQIFDRATVPVVEDGGVPVVPDEINYLDGSVTLPAPPGGVVTISGKYIPMTVVATGKEFSVELTATELDDTAFGDAGYRSRVIGLIDVSATLRLNWANGFFIASLLARLPLVFEIKPGGADPIMRAWMVIPDVGWSGDIDGIEDEEVSFALDGAGIPNADFAFL
jgi:hypothetical protein